MASEDHTLASDNSPKPAAESEPPAATSEITIAQAEASSRSPATPNDTFAIDPAGPAEGDNTIDLAIRGEATHGERAHVGPRDRTIADALVHNQTLSERPAPE